jgi:hypothetical protein
VVITHGIDHELSSVAMFVGQEWLAELDGGRAGRSQIRRAGSGIRAGAQP